MAFLTLCIAFISLLLLKQPTHTTSVSLTSRLSTSTNSSKVVIDVYYETLCPDSREFITDQLIPAYSSIKQIMTVNLVPFGKASYRKKSDGDYSFSCQHGQNECDGNMISSCVLRLEPNVDKQMKFVDCMAKVSRPWSAGQSCANSAGITYEPISQCANSRQGQLYLVEEGVKTHNLNPRLTFVPWTVFNGVYNENNRRRSYSNLKQVICSLSKEPKIDACNGAI